LTRQEAAHVKQKVVHFGANNTIARIEIKAALSGPGGKARKSK